jgi:uncharacterized protein YecE (DUF72 family)
VHLHVGTSGYSYKEWRGPFYPEGLAAKDMLSWYGGQLNAVEVNNTFYRMPTVQVLEAWAAQVPAEFRFAVKASQKITHRRRLKDAEEETRYLVRTLSALGPRLGVTLFQLPPNLKVDMDRLTSFLGTLPRDLPVAFEFRHESWKDDSVVDALRDHGAALCCADTDDSETDEPVVATAAHGYLRLRRPGYTDEDLERWVGRVLAQPWDRAFVFFKHEEAGAGPRMARRFLEVAGSGSDMSEPPQS